MVLEGGYVQEEAHWPAIEFEVEVWGVKGGDHTGLELYPELQNKGEKFKLVNSRYTP